MHSIAYLGPPGTFSEQAALAFGEGETEYVPLASIPAVVTAVETGAATGGILPIENALEGSVTSTLDLLIHETALRIAAETVVPIRHNLLARPGVTLPQISVLYAHPQSLGQCRRFVERCLPNVATVASLSNSAAPAEAMADERPAAAIAPLRMAELLGMNALARDIQDRGGNVTRFVAIGRQGTAQTGDDKTSFCFGFDREDRPGSLVEALQVLAQANINMIKIESRPSKDVFGQYIFLVDINGHHDDERIAAALDRIRAKTGFFKIFGSYPVWREHERRKTNLERKTA